MDEIIAQLNYDFNLQLIHLKRAKENLDNEARQLVTMWANKLKSASTSLEESRLRNDFLFYLVKCCENGILMEPFNMRPPHGPLLNIYSLLPQDLRRASAKTSEEKKSKLPEIFERSPDKGAFLAAQPVPRCGAFCYLAILTKAPPTE